MGEPIFALDAELPGMLYALTLECPFIGGKLKSVDTSETEQFPGVVEVVQKDGLVAVVAKNRYAAEMGKRALKPEWDVPKVWQQEDIDELVTVGKSSPINIQKEGNVKSVFKQNPAEVIQSEYRSALGVHAQMEPNGAVAKVDKEGALIIVGTQAVDPLRNEVAAATGISKNKIEIRNSFLGGGFGRRYFKHKAVDAARIAQAIGKPVHVFRDREEEFSNGYFRPSNHHVMRAKLTGGKIEAIEHEQATGDMMLDAMPILGMRTMMGADFFSAGHGAKFFYNIANRSTSIYDVKMPFQTGIWRGVGAHLNAFPIECFMDELARKLGKDPISLRLEYLTSDDPIIRRMKTAVETVRDKSNWASPKQDGIGRGFACAEDRKTVAAAVAEVKIENGKIKVLKMTNVIDPGMVINPEGVRMQVEGSVMMGLSAALYEETKVRDGQFTATNYHQYPMAMLADTPEIEVIMLEGADRPFGVGEPPIAPIAPAIANAVFDLTGKRLRSMPFRV